MNKSTYPKSFNVFLSSPRGSIPRSNSLFYLHHVTLNNTLVFLSYTLCYSKSTTVSVSVSSVSVSSVSVSVSSVSVSSVSVA